MNIEAYDLDQGARINQQYIDSGRGRLMLFLEYEKWYNYVKVAKH